MGPRSAASGRQAFLPQSDDTNELVSDDEDGSFSEMKSRQFQLDL